MSLTEVDYKSILAETEKFVIAFFENHQDEKWVYHNIAHTESVVMHTLEIGNHYNLCDEDSFIVLAAAWFHDTGYMLTVYDHEKKSAEAARDFFNGTIVSEAVIDKISQCILATRVPQKPHDVLENIICDADMYHLGSDDFAERSSLMRKEKQALSGEKISKSKWRQANIPLLENHRYHTDYCAMLLENKVKQNLQALKRKEESASKKGGLGKASAAEAELFVLSHDEPPDDEEGPKTRDKLSRGVETMFRITAGHQRRLSSIADSKAHIMISVNSIIISLLLSLLLRKMQDHAHQLIPAILLLVINLVTIVFSVLATRPMVTRGTFTAEDVRKRDVNLLFFGNFYKMDLDDYTTGIFDMMNDKDFLYRSLIRDMYAQGVVLGRKYYLLRIAYNVFMYGIIVSVIAFVISTLI